MSSLYMKCIVAIAVITYASGCTPYQATHIDGVEWSDGVSHINTYIGLYTTCVTSGDDHIRFSPDEIDLQRIFRAAELIDFWSMPEERQLSYTSFIVPIYPNSGLASIHLTHGAHEHTVRWDTGKRDDRSAKLRPLLDTLDAVIRSLPEYKQLGEPCIFY